MLSITNAFQDLRIKGLVPMKAEVSWDGNRAEEAVFLYISVRG